MAAHDGGESYRGIPVLEGRAGVHGDEAAQGDHQRCVNHGVARCLRPRSRVRYFQKEESPC